MEKIKYCPKCQKIHSIEETKCDCGFEFFVPEKQEEDQTVATSNTRVIVDNVPLGIWTFLSFITASIAGWLFYFKFKETYPERSRHAKHGAVAFYITLGIVIAIALFIIILDSKGRVIWK